MAEAKTNVPPFVPIWLLICYLVCVEYKPFQAQAPQSHAVHNATGPQLMPMEVSLIYLYYTTRHLGGC